VSTKTLRKRIALVAVTALSAGVLSVAPAFAANEGEIATSPAAGSAGVLAHSLVATNTTNTATLLSTGKLGITSTGGANSYFVVSSGAYISQGITSASTLTNAGTIGGDQKSYLSAAASNIFYVVPTGPVGSTFTITGYASAGGALVSLTTVTIAGTSIANKVDSAESEINWVAVADTYTGGTLRTTDSTGASAVTPTNPLYLQIQLKDAYGAFLTDTTGALVVTASAGATVGVVQSSSAALTGIAAAPTAGAFTTGVGSGKPALSSAIISEATAGAGWKGTVTVTYNGAVVATKSGTISGYASKLNITRNLVASYGTTTADAVRYTTTDSAGNSVSVATSAVQLDTSSASTVVSGVVGTEAQNITAGSLADGKATVTCGSPGSSTVVMKYTTPAGVTIKSNPLTVICGSSANTYTASWDKASYKQGEIAKLTVSFKDVFGAPANSQSAVTAVVSSLSNEVISTPMMTRIGSTSASALNTDENGNLVYTYTVGTTTGVTPGAYQASVSFPTVNSAKGEAQAVAYTIAPDGSVTNADVLKSIVSLIASINKQIQALQKLILRR